MKVCQRTLFSSILSALTLSYMYSCNLINITAFIILYSHPGRPPCMIILFEVNLVPPLNQLILPMPSPRSLLRLRSCSEFLMAALLSSVSSASASPKAYRDLCFSPLPPPDAPYHEKQSCNLSSATLAGRVVIVPPGPRQPLAVAVSTIPPAR